MASAMFELVLFSLPSMIWTRRLRRSGSTQRQALGAAGLQWGTRSGYQLALALVLPVAALAAILLATIPPHILHGGSQNITGAPTTASGYVAIIVLAIAEEMLFRGFIAGVLFRRLGFRKGNALQR
jgi:membrane protease YdiL (CAAX protease family)